MNTQVNTRAYIRKDETMYRANDRYNYGRRTRGCARKSTIINDKLFKVSFITFFVIFICVAGILKITAEGSNNPVNTQYLSIQIEEGDTLWELAVEYNDESISNLSIKEYIEDIKSINNLVRDDKITAGNYVIVPIYTIAEQ